MPDHLISELNGGRAPIGAAGDELQLSRPVRALVERPDAGEYTRAQAPPGESPFGRSQTLKNERLRQPAASQQRQDVCEFVILIDVLKGVPKVALQRRSVRRVYEAGNQPRDLAANEAQTVSP